MAQLQHTIWPAGCCSCCKRPQVEDKAALPGELQKAANKQQRLVSVLLELQQQQPGLAGELQKVLAHAVVPLATAS